MKDKHKLDGIIKKIKKCCPHTPLKYNSYKRIIYIGNRHEFLHYCRAKKLNPNTEKYVNYRNIAQALRGYNPESLAVKILSHRDDLPSEIYEFLKYRNIEIVKD